MIPLFKVFMSDAAKQEAFHVLSSGYIGQGLIVERFEEHLRSYFAYNHLITTNSCTSALHLAYHMFRAPIHYTDFAPDMSGVSVYDWPGFDDYDEILTTPLTCTATNWPIILNNLRIRWVDVDPTTMNMDLNDLERKLTSRTKGISIVHWGGYPVDIDRVHDICINHQNRYGYRPIIFEDCAHAFGSMFTSRYGGKRRVGTFGNISSFSFQAIKHITSVDGGALLLPTKFLTDKAKLLRWYGIDREDNRKDFRCEKDILEAGFKFHMNDVCAAIGIENLKHADIIIDMHRNNAEYYNDMLRNVNGVKLLENNPKKQSSYWLYTIRVEDQQGFMRAMKDRDIMVSRVHERNDIHTCVRAFRTELPQLDQIVREMICIPVGWWVSTEDREYIVDAIKRGW